MGHGQISSNSQHYRPTSRQEKSQINHINLQLNKKLEGKQQTESKVSRKKDQRGNKQNKDQRGNKQNSL